MEAKTYISENYRDGMSKIEKELGEDAIILSCTKFFNPEKKKEMYKIIADRDTSAKPNAKNNIWNKSVYFIKTVLFFFIH